MIRINGINYDCFMYRMTCSKEKRGPMGGVKRDIAPETVFEEWTYSEDKLDTFIYNFKNRVINKEELAEEKGKPLFETTSKYGRCWTLKNGDRYQEFIMGFVSLNQENTNEH